MHDVPKLSMDTAMALPRHHGSCGSFRRYRKKAMYGGVRQFSWARCCGSWRGTARARWRRPAVCKTSTTSTCWCQIHPKYSVAQVIRVSQGLEETRSTVAREFAGRSPELRGAALAGLRGYFVSTVGRDERIIAGLYPAAGRESDRRLDQLRVGATLGRHRQVAQVTAQRSRQPL